MTCKQKDAAINATSVHSFKPAQLVDIVLCHVTHNGDGH